MATRQEKQKAALSIVLNGLYILVVGGAVVMFAGLVLNSVAAGGSIAIFLIIGLLAYIAWKMGKR
jgi:membrane protein implicated in regulation of membrane protease activity